MLFLYLLFLLASVFLFKIGRNGEPISLALFYAMLTAGLSPFCLVLYPISALSLGNYLLFFLSLGQAVLLFLGQLLQNRLRKSNFTKTGIFSLLALSLSLGVFVAFAPFKNYAMSVFFDFMPNTLTQKVIISSLIFLFSATTAIAVKALLKKFLKCKLRNDEVIFISLLGIAVGVGICRFLGVNAYMATAIFTLLLFSYATKDAYTLLCAFVLAIPAFLVFSTDVSIFFIYGIACVLFVKTGKLAAACGVLLVFFAVGYWNGLYTLPTEELVFAVLSVLLPVLLFLFAPTALLRVLENKVHFYREKHLTRISINRNRAAIGEKLFEISSVFREIQSAFLSLDDDKTETNAKEYVCTCVEEDACKRCTEYPKCAEKNIHNELYKLVEVGCMKGKATLLDLPRRLSDVCINQSGVLYALNRQLTEYTKYMTEAENAAEGRKMLANQAQGVGEILKNLALEQSEPLRTYTDLEHTLIAALLTAGVVCSELLIFGEENNFTVSLVSFGKANVKKIAAITSQVLGQNMIISERLALSQNKFCCILRKRPYFDAAFGVATKTKQGQTACGDTHSVMQIDERRFLVALSDGMGSGSYAKRISETTISLLESFYKAKMPSPLVLSTVNKLLAFHKEERFACVDIGIVHLDSGQVDVIKIGSPIGFILSDSTVKVLEGNSLPLGILDSLRPTTATYTLEENDVLLFVSDGIIDAFGSSADLYETLRGIPLRNPQQLADTLLAEALRAYNGVAKDDMTAVAVRIFKPHTA